MSEGPAGDGTGSEVGGEGGIEGEYTSEDALHQNQEAAAEAANNRTFLPPTTSLCGHYCLSISILTLCTLHTQKQHAVKLIAKRLMSFWQPSASNKGQTWMKFPRYSKDYTTHWQVKKIRNRFMKPSLRCLPIEATELAKASVRQKVARQMKSTGSTAKFNMSDHTEELATDIASRTFKDTWFPQCWLCFIYYGLPSNDPRPCFISGSVALAKTTETLVAIRDIGAFSRDTRRKIDSVVDSLETPKRQKISSPVESGVVKQVQVNFGSITNVMDKVTAAKMRWELHSSGKPLSVIK